MHSSGFRVHSGASIDAGRAVDATPRPPRPDPMVRDADFVAPRPEMEAVRDMVAAELKAFSWFASAIGAPALADSAASLSARLLREQNWSRAGQFLAKWRHSNLRAPLRGRGLANVARRGSWVLTAVTAAWDIHSKMAQGNSLPRATFETGSGVAGGIGGAGAGCAVGAAIGAGIPGCIIGGLIGGIGGGAGGDEFGDAAADRIWGPDGDG
jgi:hypothetical protein